MYNKEDLKAATLTELREIAAAFGIADTGKMKKAEILEALLNFKQNESETTQDKATPSVGNTVTVKKSATRFSSKSGNAKMASFVPNSIIEPRYITPILSEINLTTDKS